MQVVGHIRSIWRYPVKSMAGERLESAPVTLQGITADRMYAFVQAGSASPFPWLTGREMPSLLQYQPVWVPGDRPSLRVRAPSGHEWPIDAPELGAEIEATSGLSVHLLPNYRGSFDVAPLSFISHATVDAIAKASGTPSEPGRFRMNFYVDTTGGESFAEDQWVGRILRVGDTVRVAVTEQDQRCQMITLDPVNSVAAPEVLKAAGNLNGANAGVYAAVLVPGEVREGDTITLE
jgi:uncharacterized protein